MLTIALLLKEEHAFAITLEVETTRDALQLASINASSSAPPSPSSGGDTTIVAMLHAQAYRVQNIHSPVSTVLDPSSTGYARWHDQVLLTLKCYDLIDHVLSDAPRINDPAWERMMSIVLSWIFGMITGEL
jgi:hypothetical protein